MAEYHFLTTWDLEAPIDTVWEVIGDPLHYSSWWKYVQGVSELKPREPDGTGGLYLYQWKTALPYTLAFEMTVTRFDPPHLTEANAKGELDGIGRWELNQMEGFTRVTYDWLVRTTKSWMNWMAPLFRPAFSWNHNILMDEGGKALASKLGVKLLAYTNQVLN